MEYPVISETFVRRDIDELLKQGNEIDVFTLKSDKYVSESVANGIVNVNSDQNNKRKHSKISLLVRNIEWFWLIFTQEKKLINKLKLAYLTSRSSRIAHYLERANYDIVHLYWGHFPSLVGLMLKKYKSDQIVSQFLGAYDLEADLQLSKKMVSLSDCLWTHAKGNISTEGFIISSCR